MIEVACIAVTGANGQLGRELCRQLGASGIPLSRTELDLTDAQRTRETLLTLRPQVVINTAAYTLVDRAEQEPEACRALNALAVGTLAGICNELDAKLVQISTDFVFAGERGQSTPFTEADQTAPQSVYARTKLEGELLAATCREHLIVRTCGLFGLTAKRNNFVETMLRLAEQGRALRVVDDQTCTPSHVPDVTRAIIHLIDASQNGLFHVVNAGQTTWFDFAREIFRQTGHSVSLEPITTAAYGAPAARPAYSVLSTAKYDATGGPRLPTWQNALSDYLRSRTEVTIS